MEGITKKEERKRIEADNRMRAIREKYIGCKVFKYDSHNTGYYVHQDISIDHARDLAKKLSEIGAKKANVEGDNGSFEQYENGKLTSHSLVLLK